MHNQITEKVFERGNTGCDLTKKDFLKLKDVRNIQNFLKVNNRMSVDERKSLEKLVKKWAADK